jgi:hypothetical protein
MVFREVTVGQLISSQEQAEILLREAGRFRPHRNLSDTQARACLLASHLLLDDGIFSIDDAVEQVSWDGRPKHIWAGMHRGRFEDLVRTKLLDRAGPTTEPPGRPGQYVATELGQKIFDIFQNSTE